MGRLSRTIREHVVPGSLALWWRLFGTPIPTNQMGVHEWFKAHPGAGRHIPIGEPFRIVLPRRRVVGDRRSVREFEQHLDDPALQSRLNQLCRGDITYDCRDEVHVIAGGCCAEEAGLLTSSDGHLLGDDVMYGFWRHKRLNLFKVGYMPRAVRRPGRVAVLAGGKGYFNYYHWVVDTLPRLGRLRTAGVDVESYYIPCSQSYHRQALQVLGIDSRQVIPASRFRNIRADELVIPSALYGRCSRQECDFLFQQLAEPLASGLPSGERILISRRRASVRRVLNEGQIEDALQPLGFRTVCLEELDFVSQVRLFHSAEWVIGPHGAGLTNIVFSRSGTKVIELGTAYRPLTCFHEIACHRCLRYLFFLASPRNVWLHQTQPLLHSDADLVVDPAQLLAAIENLDEGACQDTSRAA